MQKRTSPASALNIVLVTMDSHFGAAVDRARAMLATDLPGVSLIVHTADEWGSDPAALAACRADIARADIVISAMLFLDEHVRAVMPALEERRPDCLAMCNLLSAGEVVKLTRLGRLDMSAEARGPLAQLKKLRGSRGASGSSGQGQMRVLRELPRLLRFIPGTAQDLRAYFLTLQFWLAGSEGNVANLVRLLVDKFADGPRQAYRGQLKVVDPITYPEVGVYHPRLPSRIGEQVSDLPRPYRQT